MSDLSSDTCDSIANNEIAIEAISERLTEVTGLADELDQALNSAQQDCSVLTETVLTSSASTSTSTLTEHSEFRRSMENSAETEVSCKENVAFVLHIQCEFVKRNLSVAHLRLKTYPIFFNEW